MDCTEYSSKRRCHEAWVGLPYCTNFLFHKTYIITYSFVSRANPKNNDRHVILGVAAYKPREFANQMNLSLSNGWGIVRTIVDMCLKMPEGKYVLVKVCYTESGFLQ